MSVPIPLPEPDDVHISPPTPCEPALNVPSNGNGFRSGPYPHMVPAATVEESIRLSLLVAAGRIPFPTRYVPTPEGAK